MVLYYEDLLRHAYGTSGFFSLQPLLKCLIGINFRADRTPLGPSLPQIMMTLSVTLAMAKSQE